MRCSKCGEVFRASANGNCLSCWEREKARLEARRDLAFEADAPPHAAASDGLAKCPCGYSFVGPTQAHANDMAREHLGEHLKLFTDDQLRAECERRGISSAARTSVHVELERQRDEWKRRAEAAEAELKRAEARTLEWVESRAVALRPRPIGRGSLVESGPGIVRHDATARPNTAHYIDPLDLLCEDA